MKTDVSRDHVCDERAFRRRMYPVATDADWNDWRWQMKHRARCAADVVRVLKLSARERRGLAGESAWRMPLGITPYQLCLLSGEPLDGALRRTLLPDIREGRRGRGELEDPLGETAHEVTPGLIRAYPAKALLLATSDCACFCRYCTRSRTAPGVAGEERRLSQPAMAAVESWLRKHPEVRDVLISGGDPLTLSDGQLERWLRMLRGLPHIELLRMGTKVPAALPQRITPALVRMLRKYRPLWLSLHFSHPVELTPRAAAACVRLVDAGLPLLNQCVLLRGVNDDRETLQALFEGLLRIGVKPYYLHQGDMAAGTSHVRSTMARGRAILRGLSGRVSGQAIPHFMVDPPGGGGKHPISWTTG